MCACVENSWQVRERQGEVQRVDGVRNLQQNPLECVRWVFCSDICVSAVGVEGGWSQQSFPTPAGLSRPRCKVFCL